VLVIVHRYVDGECDLETALAVAAHLDACPECEHEVLEIRWLKAAVRRCGGRPGL
jgi:anti-sigma factor RsiW